MSEKATEDEERAALQHWHYGVSSNNYLKLSLWVGNDCLLKKLGSMEYVRFCYIRLYITHLNTRALYPDSCLYIVPKSHKTPRTEDQRSHSNGMAPPTDPSAMPGAIRLTLQRKNVWVRHKLRLPNTIYVQRENLFSTIPTYCTAEPIARLSAAQRCMLLWGMSEVDPRELGTFFNMA